MYDLRFRSPHLIFLNMPLYIHNTYIYVIFICILSMNPFAVTFLQKGSRDVFVKRQTFPNRIITTFQLILYFGTYFLVRTRARFFDRISHRNDNVIN